MDFLKWARYHWDRLSAAVLAGFGVLALILGYVGVSGTVYPAEQLPYMISGGILGLFCLGAAGVLYISADMRDEWRKLDSIDEKLKEIAGTTTLETEQIDAAAAGTQDAPASTTADRSDAEKPATRRRTTRAAARQASGSAS